MTKLFLVLLLSISSCQTLPPDAQNEFANFIVDPKTTNIEFFWKNDRGEIFRSIENLKKYVEGSGRSLKFAMNGGMYEPGNVPKGLFVQNGQTLIPLDTKNGEGNFYLEPNGVFYLSFDGQPFITETKNFQTNADVKFATQSGPMLIVNGEINSKFAKDSANLQIRNGAGILPDKSVVFAISRQKISLYKFAEHFKNLGCREALYLDGYVSRMYAPESKFEQLDGDFGVIIGIAE